MSEYKFDKIGETCAASGRKFVEGDTVYTSLIETEEGRLARQDYLAEFWTEARRDSAWVYWRSTYTVDPKTRRRRMYVDDGVLLEFFRRLEGDSRPERVNFRYLLGLLLVRKKRLIFVEVEHTTSPQGETEILVLQDGDKTCRVPDPHLTEEQIAAVKEQMTAVFREGVDFGQEQEAESR